MKPYADPESLQAELHLPDIARYLDTTILKPQTSSSQIYDLCESAARYNFRSIRIPPSFVRQAFDHLRQSLNNTSVLIGTVIDFPFGYSTLPSKRSAIAEAIADGADECDIVLSHQIKMSGHIYEEMSHYQSFSNKINIIPILEVSHFDDMKDKLLSVVKQLDAMNYIKVIKTSTGVNVRPTTPEDIKFLKSHFFERFLIKASGGISDFDKTMAVIKEGANIIGTSSAENIKNDFDLFKRKNVESTLSLKDIPVVKL